MPQQQRRKYWVNPRIQGRLIGRVAFYWLVYHLVLWHVMFLVRYVGYRAALITGESQYVSFNSLYLDFSTDYMTLAVCAVLLAPLFLYDMLQQSHRLAGPLLRCENTMKRLMAGEQAAPIQFRDNDLPVDFGVTFNEFLAFYAKQNRAAGPPAMTPQQAALLEGLEQDRSQQSVSSEPVTPAV